MKGVRARSWSPYAVGVGIGLLSWFAFATADHGLGITTPFEHTAALAHGALDASAKATNPWFSQNTPKIGWEWMLVVGVFVGSLLSSMLSGDRRHPTVPRLWRERFGDSALLRLTVAFAGGAVMMIGARLADGCTSGHGITGALELSVSSFVFITLAFAVAVGTALLLYGRPPVAAAGDE